MKSIALVALLLVPLLGACRKKTRSACDESIAGVLDRAVSSDNDDPVPAAIEAMKQRMNEAFAKLCMDDKHPWSNDVLACLDDANDPSAAKACEAKLTPEQKQELEKSMGEVLGLPIAEKK